MDNGEGHTIQQLKEYYGEVISVSTNLLNENKEEWKEKYKEYLSTPAFLGHEKYWFLAYKNVIRKVERKTGTSFYFTTQGSASLRYNGSIVIERLCCANSKGKIVSGTIDNKSGKRLDDPKTIDLIKQKVKELKEKELGREDNPLESYYEAGILKALNDDNKQKRNTFYRHIKPIKRLNNGRTGNTKEEIGLFQMNTPFEASGFKNNPEQLIYSGASSGGGIDILARRGKTRWDSILTLIEVKNEYKKASEPPEITMGQLIAYAVFMCNLIEEDPYEWGRAFGYMDGYKKKELNLIVMLPMPDDNNPRTDFLSNDSTGADMELETINEEKYVLHLHYAYFDPANYVKVIHQSIGSLDRESR